MSVKHVHYVSSGCVTPNKMSQFLNKTLTLVPGEEDNYLNLLKYDLKEFRQQKSLPSLPLFVLLCVCEGEVWYVCTCTQRYINP